MRLLYEAASQGGRPVTAVHADLVAPEFPPESKRDVVRVARRGDVTGAEDARSVDLTRYKVRVEAGYARARNFRT